MKSYIFLAALLLSTIARGQGLDASPAGIMISHGHPKGSWMFSYTYMSMMMKDNLSGTEKVNDQAVFNQDYAMSPQTMSMDMHMLMAMYGLTGRVSIMLMTNYSVMSMDMTAFAQQMQMEGGTMIMNSPYMTVKSSGFGDVKLYGLYKLMNGNGSQLVVSAGINMPTGSINLTGGDQYLNMRLPYMMQLGTGSFDLLPGITYLKRSMNVTWSAHLLSAIRPFDNANGYHYGNEVTANVWAAYKFCPLFSASLRLEGYASGAIQGHDPLIYMMNEPGANPQNYGGSRMSGYMGANYYLNSGALKYSKLSIEYGLPFYQNLNGPQLATQSTLNAAFTISF